MGLEPKTISLPEHSVIRIKNLTEIIINTYCLIAERSITEENEADLEGFARILHGYSVAINENLRINNHNQLHEIGLLSEEIGFRIDCFDVIFPN